MVIKVLNQKLHPQKQSTSSLSTEMEMAIETDHISISSSSTVMEMKKTETELKTKLDQNGAKQRVKKLKRVKQRANRQHYSHAPN